MKKFKSSFSRNLQYHLLNPHHSKKAVLRFTSGAYNYTDISELLVALRTIQLEYENSFGLHN